MAFDAFFFDLDGTLYNTSCGMLDHINHLIEEWILRVVPMPPDKVSSFRHDMFQKYGGTLPGLAIEYGSDYYASLRYCHDFRAEDFVSENPELRRQLQMLPGRKYILTTSYRFYTVRVLKALGILDCFDGIIDAIDVFPTLKPAPEAFQRALQITAEPDVRRCVFLDDQPRNVAAGHREGFFAVQVGTEYPKDPLADAWIPGIEDLISIPELFEEGQ